MLDWRDVNVYLWFNNEKNIKMICLNCTTYICSCHGGVVGLVYKNLKDETEKKMKDIYIENGCELCDEGGEAPLRDDGINVCDDCDEKYPISDFGGR